MVETPFSAKTPDPKSDDPLMSVPRRCFLTRRPWLIRCSYRITANFRCSSSGKIPDRSNPNDCNGPAPWLILKTVSWMLLVVLGVASPGKAASPEEILRAYGLQRVEKSWLVPEEIDLHERVEELGKLERRLQDAKRECDAQILSLEQLRAQLKTAETTKTRLARVLKTAPAGQLRTMLERDQKEQAQLAAKLREGLPPAETLGGLAPLKGLLAEQCALRAEFVLGYLEANRLEAGLAKQYAELAKNRELMDALAELPNQMLGQAKRLATDQKTLQKYRATAFAANVPFYREGKRIRVSLVLNDELPATVSWHDENDATLLPYSVAQNLGLTEKARGKAEQLTLPKEKLNLQGWFATLDKVRVGQSFAEKVSVFILAPEHEVLGGRLGYELQQQLLLTLDADRLQIKCGVGQKSSDMPK